MTVLLVQIINVSVFLQIGDPQDEHDHLVHHNATDVLRFNVSNLINII